MKKKKVGSFRKTSRFEDGKLFLRSHNSHLKEVGGKQTEGRLGVLSGSSGPLAKMCTESIR